MVRSQEPYSSIGTKLSHPIACQTLAKSSYILLAAKIGNCQRPTGQTGLVLCNPNHVRSDLQSPFVTRFGRGMSSPAYKYKGHDRLRFFLPNRINQLTIFIFSPNPSFSKLCAILCSSIRCPRASWVACRPQDNPRSASSDGVPPELAVLGFRGVSAPTGLTGGCSRSDWPTWGFTGEDRLRSARASAFVCWPDLRKQIRHDSRIWEPWFLCDIIVKKWNENVNDNMMQYVYDTLGKLMCLLCSCKLSWYWLH